MAEGTLMETLIAVGSAGTVLIAVVTLAYRLVIGDAQRRRIEKLKDELEKNQQP